MNFRRAKVALVLKTAGQAGVPSHGWAAFQEVWRKRHQEDLRDLLEQNQGPHVALISPSWPFFIQPLKVTTPPCQPSYNAEAKTLTAHCLPTSQTGQHLPPITPASSSFHPLHSSGSQTGWIPFHWHCRSPIGHIYLTSDHRPHIYLDTCHSLLTGALPSTSVPPALPLSQQLESVLKHKPAPLTPWKASHGFPWPLR